MDMKKKKNRIAENGDMLKCATHGDVDGLRRRLEGNADVAFEDSMGNTALMHASRQGHIECLKLLLEHRAAIAQQNSRNGWTALFFVAASSGDKEIMELLLQRKADVHHQDMWSNTALIYASKWGKAECVRLLLEYMSDVNHRNNHGNDALSLCCALAMGRSRMHEKHLIQFLLLSCGAAGEDGKESAAKMKTSITSYHTNLKKVLSDEVVGDTRFHLEQNGLYHEPLERVMEYCGLDLMLENDPNRDEDDPIPILLGGRTRASSASIGGITFTQKGSAILNLSSNW